MIEAGQTENISSDLRELSDAYHEKVKKGEAKYAGSGFKGKGYSYNSSEMNDAQKLVRMEKRQALIEAGMLDPDEGEGNEIKGCEDGGNREGTDGGVGNGRKVVTSMQANLPAEILALPGMKDAILRQAGIDPPTSSEPGSDGMSIGNTLSTGSNHFVEEIEINDYPREARWKVTQKETTSRLQDEFQTAVTLKGQFFDPKSKPVVEGERKLYLHLEATSDRVLKACVQEIRRLLNEETLRVGTRGLGGGHKYNVFG